MADANSESPTSSVEPDRTDGNADDNHGSKPRTGPKPFTPSVPPTSATIDELLAKEALANLKRARAAAHADAGKVKTRAIVPPARLVVRQQYQQAWRRPFVSLAIVVGLSTLLNAAGLAYFFVQPLAPVKTSDAEVRTLRDNVAQLRRSVIDLSSEVASNRTALAAIGTAASDRQDRLARTMAASDRDQPAPSGKSERAPSGAIDPARLARVDIASEITGTIPRQAPTIDTRPDVIAGWRVRRVYDGVAVLDGDLGVIEVVLGQTIPDLGRILDIKSENGRWQVLTTKGRISSAN